MLQRVKTNKIGVESIEASARLSNPLAGFQPLPRDFRVEGVIMQSRILNDFFSVLKH